MRLPLNIRNPSHIKGMFSDMLESRGEMMMMIDLYPSKGNSQNYELANNRGNSENLLKVFLPCYCAGKTQPACTAHSHKL